MPFLSVRVTGCWERLGQYACYGYARGQWRTHIGLTATPSEGEGHASLDSRGQAGESDLGLREGGSYEGGAQQEGGRELHFGNVSLLCLELMNRLTKKCRRYSDCK